MADWFDDIDEKFDPEEREREEAERRARLEAQRLEREEAERVRREEERLRREEERLRREREILEGEEYNRRLRRRARMSEVGEKVGRIALIALILLIIGGILFGIVWGIVAAIRGIGNAISANRERKEYERYSIDNIVITEVEKERQSARLSYTIKNNSTYDVERVYGDMVIYDIYGDEVARVKGLYYSGTIESGKSLDTYFDFSDYENEFYLYTLPMLTIEYNIKEIDYSNGETRQYEDGLKVLSSVNIREATAPEYSLDLLEYSVTSKEPYSSTAYISFKNNNSLDVNVFRVYLKFYDENGALVGDFGRIYWGTMRSGTTDTSEFVPDDYTDAYYYGDLSSLRVTVAFRSVTYSDGVTVIYPEEEIVINNPFSEAVNAA